MDCDKLQFQGVEHNQHQLCHMASKIIFLHLCARHTLPIEHASLVSASAGSLAAQL